MCVPKLSLGLDTGILVDIYIITWMEEPLRLQSMGSLRVRQD